MFRNGPREGPLRAVISRAPVDLIRSRIDQEKTVVSHHHQCQDLCWLYNSEAFKSLLRATKHEQRV